MVLTTLWVCLEKTIGLTTWFAPFFRSIICSAIIVCLPLLTACGSSDGASLAELFRNGHGPGPSEDDPNSSSTGAAQLDWAPVADPNVVGYFVYYGTQPSNASGSCAYADRLYFPLDSLANTEAPSVIIDGLALETTFYFAVTAYNGDESVCSNEVSKMT